MLQAKFKNLFFDSKGLESKLDAAERRWLSKVGAQIRRTAQKSLAYRKGKSPAGTPPHVHKHEGFKRRLGKSTSGRKRASSPLKELIYFAHDPTTSSVVVGPVLFRESAAGAGHAPRVLEEGGTSPVIVDGKIKRGNYQKRPYMAPALSKVGPVARADVKDMIR